jgi:hypothetical protein
VATAGDRLQIVLAAKNEISGEIKQTKSDLTSLGRTASALADRMERGEQGLQGEYEQTRREIERNRVKLIELGRKQAQASREYKQLTTAGKTSAMTLTRSFDKVSRGLGLTGDKATTLRRNLERLDEGAFSFKTKWGSALGSVDRKMDGTRRSGGVMAAGWGKVAGAAAAVTGGVMAMSGAFNFLAGSVQEARDARKAAAQTAAVLRSMGRTESPAALTKMIDQIARMSGIDDDEIRSLTNVMLTFGNVTGDTFTKANRLAVDLSAAFGKDLQSSAVMVGKALNDPAKGLTALSRIGVSFTQQQQDQVKAMMAVGDIAGAQKIIMHELGRQVKGSAAAQSDAIGRTQVAWGNLKEAIGETLMSAGTGGFGLAEELRKATKWIKQHKVEIVAVLQKIISVVFKVISIWLKWQSIALKAFGYIIGGIASLLQAMAWLDPSMQGAADNAKALAKGFGDASEKADRASKYFNDLAKKSGEASGAAQRLKDKLKAIGVEVDNLNGKKVKNLLDNNRVPGVNSQGGVTRFAGGPVAAGQTYLVGEIGPELFVPNGGGEPQMVGMGGMELRDFHASGTIIPTSLVGAYMAANQPTAATLPVSGGATVNIGTINASADVDVEAAVLNAQLRADRIARERR